MAESHDGRLAALVTELGGDGVRFLFRDLVQNAMQELIDAELSEAIGAGPHERTDTRSNYRNGARDRDLSTPAGDVELRIPKLRVGVVLPVAAGASPPGGQGVVGGDHDRLRHRDLDPEGRRPGQSAGVRHRGLEVHRVDGSVPRSTNRSTCSGPAVWITSRSRTCLWTPPTSKPASITTSCRERGGRDRCRRRREPGSPRPRRR